MYDFDYVRPENLADAIRFYSRDGAKLLAGGMTLLPTCKQRLANPSIMVDLGALDELVGIKSDGEIIRIGAMTTHATAASSDILRTSIPALAELARGIGDVQVRNRGTIGGSLANNDPTADYPAGILALDGVLITTKRRIGADDFFVGMFETALDPDEILVALEITVPKKAGYANYRNRASRYSVIGVMVAEGRAGVRVAVTGAGNGVFRVKELETALERDWSVSAAEAIRVSPDVCSSDMHASATYRAHLISVMARRAIERAAERNSIAPPNAVSSEQGE